MKQRIEEMLKKLKGMEDTVRYDAQDDIRAAIWGLTNALEIVSLPDDKFFCDNCHEPIKKHTAECPLCGFDFTV